jgi:hypothetical protein
LANETCYPGNDRNRDRHRQDGKHACA